MDGLRQKTSVLQRIVLAAALLVTSPAIAFAQEGRSPDAIADAIRALPADAPEEQRRTLQAELAEAKKKVATVVVKTTAGGEAEAAREGSLLVDERHAADLPLARPLYLAPGKHRIAIDAPGRKFVPVEVELTAGQNVAVTLREVDAAPAPTAPATIDKPLWPGILLASVGAVGIGAGIGLIVASANKESEAEDLGGTLDSCDIAALSGPCEELSSTVADRNAFQNGAVVAFIVGGIAGAASLAYFLIPTPNEAADAGAVSVAPVLGPTAWGLTIGGTF
jgi:hypothetical protein